MKKGVSMRKDSNRLQEGKRHSPSNLLLPLGILKPRPLQEMEGEGAALRASLAELGKST